MLRLFIALPFAGIISLALFSFMSWMIDNGHQRVTESAQALSFTMIMVEQEQDLQRRQRSLPEPLQLPEPPPQSPVTQAQTVAVETLAANALPALGLDTVMNGVAISAPTFGDFGTNQQAMPLYRVEPVYPAKALKRSVEGFVTLSFTIDEMGKATNIKVVEAKPVRMFEREAIQAVKKWKYQPQIVDGQAISQNGQTVTVEFKIAK
ncbi:MULTISPECIES: energy transducer TonB [Vibrio]|uniref:Protein TonB n=1 Tax=Vibrio aestuarianus TaxID=28171 RepID=A0A7X6NAQ3_9VIBR|nr:MULTISPECIES: energy transducer TonB [Vibrio]KOE80744.1 energy transducer TonB [Vibrio alginolyticus]MDE1209089.1 energy transducer TonB [Vibrio aestuarianus]MDE1221684.1 energy transducer TonB [Vibrio aestuarianus]MDE1242470.1 energy transducer TonB [Vibrio aestuarianus]MDE1252122.1 energy transducer TonB [Vibrio aestuarianus]